MHLPRLFSGDHFGPENGVYSKNVIRNAEMFAFFL